MYTYTYIWVAMFLLHKKISHGKAKVLPDGHGIDV